MLDEPTPVDPSRGDELDVVGGGHHVVGDCTEEVPPLGLSEPLVLKDFALVTSCRINLGSGILLSNVVLASNGGNGGDSSSANIVFGEGDVLGAPDDCLEGGGVQVFSTADVRSPAKLTLHGAQIIAAGDVGISAQAEGLNGVNIQAGGDIDISSNNDLGAFGACAGTAPDLLTVDYYRLVL